MGEGNEQISTLVDRYRKYLYYDGNVKSTRTISMSVAKSFVSFLIGVAFEEGQIADLQDPVDTYAPHLKGSGYQWWIPENPQGDFTAIGIYGQFIYVHPGHNVVIAKTSAYVDYNNSGDEMEFESMEAFRAIAKGL